MTQRQGSKSVLRELLRGHYLRVAGLAATSVVGGLAEAGFLVMITRVGFAVADGQTLVNFGAGVYNVGTVAGFAALAVVIRVSLALVSSQQSARISALAVASARRDLSHAFLRASWEVQQGGRTGQLQEILTTFSQRSADLMGSVTLGVTSVFNLLSLLGLAIAVDPGGSVVAIGAVAGLGLALHPMRKAIRRHALGMADGGMEFATTLAEISQLGMEMHVFNVQRETERRVDCLIEENSKMAERLLFLRGAIPVLYTGLAYLSVVGGVGLVSVTDATNISSLGAVLLVMLRSLSYGQGVQSSLTLASTALPFVEMLRSQVEWFRTAEVANDGKPLVRVGNLDLDAVDFCYVEGQPTLTNVTATIWPSEIIGVVGPSGSGKSTLVQLLLGLRTPTAGRITADSVEIGQFARPAWARKVTFVPQTAHLVSGSVAENIRFYRPSVTQDDVERAARLAHLHVEVMRWPERYSRQVGQLGGHLSGGQQQRLCIARALVEEPDILILDEPTSALDARSESLILETLTALRERMTVIVITHRMSLLKICDRVMVIQQGRLVAFDTPANLAQTSDLLSPGS